MKSLPIRILIVAMCVAAITGCDTSHPAAPAIDATLEAVTYGDAERVFAGHITSTDQNPYCTSEAFTRLMDTVRKARNDAVCEKVRRIDLAALDGEARLLAQLQRAACDDPELDCRRYARRVFDSHYATLPRIKGAEVRRILGDDVSAAAYVDLETASGESLHRTIKFESVAGAWKITSGLFEVEE